MEITHIKTIKLTVADNEEALRARFNVPNAVIHFQVVSDPCDDDPGFSRHILDGAILTEDQLAPRPGPQKR